MKLFKLDNEPKLSSGFTTPEGYFDSLGTQINERLLKPEPKVIPFFSRRKTWYCAAAAVIVMLLSIPVYHNFSDNPQDIDAVALEDYITNHTSINEDDIASLLGKADLDKMKIELNLQDQEVEDILLNNSDLEQYITE